VKYRLRMIPYCGSMAHTIREGTLEECYAAAQRRIVRHERDDGEVSVLEEGMEWELETPETAAMVSDCDGYLKIELVPEEIKVEEDEEVFA
jgi:hypothetical protein